jgi:codanin-1
MALPNIDLTKLSKLRQRLVAPSLFSTQYLFPGNQSFFRDFIECTENNPIFIHQLKLCLINELIEMNNSSYEIFNIESNNRDDDFHEYMVSVCQIIKLTKKTINSKVC